MKKTFLLLAIFSFAVLMFEMVCTAEGEGNKGQTLFRQQCSPCHPDGGNIINPQKTLHKKDREANGVKTAADIVGKMRNPGPGMTKFDGKTIPDADAKAIAEYVVKTFK